MAAHATTLKASKAEALTMRRNLESFRNNIMELTEEERKQAETQITEKLHELQHILKNIHSESLKEDRFTAIMNTIMSTL